MGLTAFVLLIVIVTFQIITTKSQPQWMYQYSVRSQPENNSLSEVLNNGSDHVLFFESDTNYNRNPLKESRTGPSKTKQHKLPLFLVRFLSIFELNRVVKEMENGAMSYVSCAACTYGVKLVHYILKFGGSHDDIAKVALRFCIDLHIESDRVCTGVINAFKNEILYVLSKTTLTAHDICSIIVGDSCGPSMNPDTNWTVTFPPIPKPPVKPVPSPKPGSPTLKVLHMSDPHLDPLYQENADAECGEPLCCRQGDEKTTDPKRAAGKWGDYRKCDTPLRTLDHMLNHIVKNHKIDYILWTGDLPPHDIWNQSRADQIDVLKETTKILLNYFPNTPIFPALGNHESAPVNSFPPPFITGNDSVSWLYDALSESWSHWLPEYTRPTIRKGAFYSVLVSPSFRIISLNMNYCNNRNWWLLLNSTDPAQELQWLIYELQYAEHKNEKVHIIAHIPPGFEDCIKVWSQNYYDIVNRYENVIVGQFFGHTHADEFEIFYDTSNLKRPTNIAYIGPSVTPYVGFNPAYRIYTIDGMYMNSTYAVLDHENYMMDLEKANKQGEPQWVKLYSAKDAYNMKSLQPHDWDITVNQMITNDTLFQEYYKNYHRASSAYPPCDKKCKIQLLCAIKSAKSHDPSQCADIRRKLPKRKS